MYLILLDKHKNILSKAQQNKNQIENCKIIFSRAHVKFIATSRKIFQTLRETQLKGSFKSENFKIELKLPSNFATSALSSLVELYSSGTDDVLRRELSLVVDEDATMKEVVAVIVVVVVVVVEGT